MKKIYFLLLVFSFVSTTIAQIVNIPDANFKAKLLFEYPLILLKHPFLDTNSRPILKIDDNSDGEIQVSEALNVGYLDVSDSGIKSLSGIESFSNLHALICDHNSINSLSNIAPLSKLVRLDYSYNKVPYIIDVSPFPDLLYLVCKGNSIKTIDSTKLKNLIELSIDNNQILEFDTSALTNLSVLTCGNNYINSIDVSNLINLTSFDCSFNKISTIDLSKLLNLYFLNINHNKFIDINVNGLHNLRRLECGGNQISILDVSTLKNLEDLICSQNLISILDVSTLINLKNLVCSNNTIINLDTSKLPNLEYLTCENNKIELLDLRNSTKLRYSYLRNNNLKTLLIKNGKYDDAILIDDNPSIKYICVDEFELERIQKKVDYNGYINCSVNSFCKIEPLENYYTILGTQKFDNELDGCDNLDRLILNFKFNIDDGSSIGSFISNISGNYQILVNSGDYTITPTIENPNYFLVSPASININFPTQTSPFIQNFCITPNGVHPDLEITLLPLQPARPGFDAKYRLVYKNKGNQLQSGTVTLDFDDAVLDLEEVNPIQTSQNATSLSWNFSDLQPFETREISFTMNVNSPQEIPAVINGDVLAYTATITSSATDETPSDNTFTFNQIVVGSYDPNDKTCLEGTVISPDLIGQYVHYLIRFENTGTFAAENVVVKDFIDLTKFDISTLVPTSASHSFTTRISEGNKVEFIFENINLPFDDANNDGYVAFKIKTQPTLKVGDSIENEASIFFDFNFPIITEPAISTFRNPVTNDINFDTYFTAYPIPSNQALNLIPKKPINIDSISIYNNLGQEVLVNTKSSKIPNVDVSSLSAGNYFIKITTDKGITSTRFIKE